MKKVLLTLVVAALLSGCMHKGRGQQVRTLSDKIQPTALTTMPSDNQCVKDFTALRGLNDGAFTLYRAQFDDINRLYALYQRNAAVLGKDPKELMSMELSAKLNHVCSRVKHAVYTEVQKKLMPVSNM